MNDKPTDKQLLEMAESLEGSCQSVDYVLELYEFEDNTTNVDLLNEKLAEIGIQECQQCNWWVEESEMDENEYCQECQEQNEDC